jgi:hypothetical protein
LGQSSGRLGKVSASVPPGSEGLSELKLDRYRLLVWIDHGRVRLVTRNGNDWTLRLPRLAADGTTHFHEAAPRSRPRTERLPALRLLVSGYRERGSRQLRERSEQRQVPVVAAVTFIHPPPIVADRPVLPMKRAPAHLPMSPPRHNTGIVNASDETIPAGARLRSGVHA